MDLGGGVKTFLEGSVDYIIYRDYIANQRSFTVVWPVHSLLTIFETGQKNCAPLPLDRQQHDNMTSAASMRASAALQSQVSVLILSGEDSGGEEALQQPGRPAMHRGLRAENRIFHSCDRREEKHEKSSVFTAKGTSFLRPRYLSAGNPEGQQPSLGAVI